MPIIDYLRYIEHLNFAAIRHEVREADREDHGCVLRRADGQAHHVPARTAQDDHLQRGPGREARLALYRTHIHCFQRTCYFQNPGGYLVM
jgi:hypothetical protein